VDWLKHIIPLKDIHINQAGDEENTDFDYPQKRHVTREFLKALD